MMSTLKWRAQVATHSSSSRPAARTSEPAIGRKHLCKRGTNPWRRTPTPFRDFTPIFSACQWVISRHRALSTSCIANDQDVIVNSGRGIIKSFNIGLLPLLLTIDQLAGHLGILMPRITSNLYQALVLGQICNCQRNALNNKYSQHHQLGIEICSDLELQLVLQFHRNKTVLKRARQKKFYAPIYQNSVFYTKVKINSCWLANEMSSISIPSEIIIRRKGESQNLYTGT